MGKGKKAKKNKSDIPVVAAASEMSNEDFMRHINARHPEMLDKYSLDVEAEHRRNGMPTRSSWQRFHAWVHTRENHPDEAYRIPLETAHRHDNSQVGQGNDGL